MNDTTSETHRLLLDVDSLQFAYAWKAVTAFCAVDEEDPGRSVCCVQIEVISDTIIRLVATDRYSLATTLVTAPGVDPRLFEDLEDEPSWWIAVDPQKGTTIPFLFKDTTERVSLDLSDRGLTIIIGKWAHLCRANEIRPLHPSDWRGVLAAARRPSKPPFQKIRLGTATLPKLAALTELGGQDTAVALTIAGALDPVYFAIDDPTPVRGMLMPVRVGGGFS